jgi:hypothetical protein
LSYEILKKNKHNSRINISGNYTIVINSLEVFFGIKRQCAKVGIGASHELTHNISKN